MSYLLPLIHHLREPRNKKGFRGVIVAPTRELAGQIFRECQKLAEVRNLRPFIIDKVAKCTKKLVGQKLDILVTTPNRYIRYLTNFYRFIVQFRLTNGLMRNCLVITLDTSEFDVSRQSL